MDLSSMTMIDLPPTVCKLTFFEACGNWCKYASGMLTFFSGQADFHGHLREGAMMELVTPLIQSGGCDTILVMPNLSKPIVSVSEALAYHEQLSRLAPNVTFLMTLYLHPDVTPEQIEQAARTQVIFGVKLYPAGETTNSQHGVHLRDIKRYYPVFEAMQEFGLVLNLHGELSRCSPDAATLEDSMNAESNFLPTVFTLHQDFPDLRIVSSDQNESPFLHRTSPLAYTLSSSQ